jgi:ribosomal protein L11 methyltransferase
MAFGTGNHETTSLMMEALLKLPLPGKKVLDMGCGTGILAILASKLGATSVVAIDNDPWSFNATSENILINQTLNIQPVLGDASSLGTENFDFILANIHKNVILSDIGKYASVLKSGGSLLCSGFFDKDLGDIEASAASCNLKPAGTRSKNHWILATFRKI